MLGPSGRWRPMPLVALAWGSPSTRRVRCSAVARLAARLTAVVVFPTPPFWLAMAMTRPTCGFGSGREAGEYIRRSEPGPMFHVKRPASVFHVEQGPLLFTY